MTNPRIPALSLSYCPKCSLPLGVGHMPRPASHVVPKTGVRHEGVLVAINKADQMPPGEKVDSYLSRMMKKYATKSK